MVEEEDRMHLEAGVTVQGNREITNSPGEIQIENGSAETILSAGPLHRSVTARGHHRVKTIATPVTREMVLAEILI